MMLESAPQPDADLIILPEYGGQSGLTGRYCSGAPELVVEISVSRPATIWVQKGHSIKEAG